MEATPPLPPPVSGSWSQVLRKGPPPKPVEEPISSRVFGSCESTNGILVAVVDANAIIHGDKLARSADKFVSVAEALEEVRDPVSRQRLAFFPIHVDTMDPSPDSIKKVVKFARETGDLQSLSDVDLKIIALAYTLEAQIHGTSHLREKPPPLRQVKVKNLSQTEMPGWGSNVPNLAEWEALENNAIEGEDNSNSSRILPLKDISSNIASSEKISNVDANPFPMRHMPSHRSKKEIDIEGKKMVAHGIDASNGEYGDNTDDWRPAVCRSTHRSYLRRKARRERHEDSQKLTMEVGSPEVSTDGSPGEKKQENVTFADGDGMDGSIILNGTCNADVSSHQVGEIDQCASELDNLEIDSQADGSIDMSQTDEMSSEQSWTLRSMSESTVACVTSDFAMQNVILQIGLRLLVPGGMQIRQLHRWVLKCHACNTVTPENERLFCPKCGNGGTLRKVSVTVGENGIVLADRRRRINLRGTKFSVPLPQGGREGVTKNFVLREDQLPKKFLYPRTKKKNNEQDFFTADDFFTQIGKKAALKPPIGKAVSVFMGKRNLNDNHFSRRRR